MGDNVRIGRLDGSLTQGRWIESQTVTHSFPQRDLCGSSVGRHILGPGPMQNGVIESFHSIPVDGNGWWMILVMMMMMMVPRWQGDEIFTRKYNAGGFPRRHSFVFVVVVVVNSLAVLPMIEQIMPGFFASHCGAPNKGWGRFGGTSSSGCHSFLTIGIVATVVIGMDGMIVIINLIHNNNIIIQKWPQLGCHRRGGGRRICGSSRML